MKDKIHKAVDDKCWWCGEGKVVDPLPPVYGVQGMASPDQEDMEGYREGSQVETSKSPLCYVTVEGEVHRGRSGTFEEH